MQVMYVCTLHKYVHALGFFVSTSLYLLAPQPLPGREGRCLFPRGSGGLYLLVLHYATPSLSSLLPYPVPHTGGHRYHTSTTRG